MVTFRDGQVYCYILVRWRDALLESLFTYTSDSAIGQLRRCRIYAHRFCSHYNPIDKDQNGVLIYVFIVQEYA